MRGTWLAFLLVPLAARAEVTFNGYVSARQQFTLPSEASLVSTRDLALLHSLEEANVQGRFRGLEDKLTVFVDASAFASWAGVYADAEYATGRLHLVNEHDVVANRPFVAFSEAYAAWDPVEHVSVTAGKKRVVWGPGMAWSPTDLINPPRDPTDPALQRGGAWMAKLDLPFEAFTLTALVAPKALYAQDGIPYAFLVYPDYPPAETVRNAQVFPDPRDGDPHLAVATRLYALVLNADVNAWVVWTHRYNDAFEHKPRGAFTFSRYFLDNYEVHLELLGQLGSARSSVTPDCVVSRAALTTCGVTGTPVLAARELESDQFLPRLLLGTRTALHDDTQLSIEYLYQADGYSPSRFQDYVRLQKRVGTLMRQGAVTSTSMSNGGGDLPLRLAFEPTRRHYLLLSVLRPRVAEDFSLQGTWIAGLEDLSSLAAGSVSWSAREWMTWTLYAFVPLPSPGHLASRLPEDPLAKAADALGDRWQGLVPRGAEVDGRRYGEFDASPFRARLVAEVRAFF